jgi:hypothetical protein
MKLVAIFIRPGHSLADDLETALTRLRDAGVAATKEEVDRNRPSSHRLLWVEKDNDRELAMGVLLAAGLAAARV